MAPTLAVVGNQMKAVPRPVNIYKDRRRSSEEVTLERPEDSSKNSNHGVTIVKMCNRLAIKRDSHSYQDIYEFEGYRGPKSPSIETQLSTKPTYHVEPKRTPKQSEFTLELQQNASTVETQSMPVASTKESIACMSPPSLAELMERKPDELLLIDCRNFIDYNSNHILGALNISCTNRITRRRLVDGKVTINDLVSGGDEAKKLYKEKEDGNATMVLYDENAIDVASLSNDHSLKLLANKLHSQGKDVKFLFGGIESFQRSFGHHCSQPSAPPQPPLLFSPTSPYVDAAIDTAVMTEVLPFLYLGNERDAANHAHLCEQGITHVLNVTSQIPLYCEDKGIECKRLPASDSGSQNLKQYFDEAIRFIESARMVNGRVLVHCQAGVSRSPSITIAYLMAEQGRSLTDAFDYVKAKRNIISPNLNFMGQLYEFQQRVNKSCPAGTPREDDIMA